MKRIIRYVAGTLDHSLHYPRCPGAAHFVGYSDNDHAGDIDTSKSTSGTTTTPATSTLSSCEAEYIAASTAST